MAKRSQLCIDLLTLCISALTLGVLIYTAYYVKEYWRETQIMKEQMIDQSKEMINQTKISSQTLKASFLPILDVQFEVVDPYTINFAYDIYLQNKGNGPAFNVKVLRQIPPDKKQKSRLRPSRCKLEQKFFPEIPMVGRSEKIKIHREHCNSYEYVKFTVTYRDLSKEFHKCIFEGDRDGLTVTDYPLLKDFQNDK